MTRMIRYGLFTALAAFGILLGSPHASAGAPVPLYTFQNGNDGGLPVGNLVADPAGNLFGVAFEAGQFGGGLVFELSPPVVPATTWTYTVLHSFTGGSDGNAPAAGLVRDSAGNLYGVTNRGGLPNCDICGTAFKLSPPPSGSDAWTFNTIYRFRPITGISPRSRLTLDGHGNLFGTTSKGGRLLGCCGVAFELSPPSSGHGSWTEAVLHVFTGGSDGRTPIAGLTFDSSGNLYGTTFQGGVRGGCCGVVFELSPPVGGKGGWIETVLHAFTGPDGARIATDLAFDGSGNIYGAASAGAGNGTVCTYGCGTIFGLSPPSGGSGSWNERTLHRFTNPSTGADPVTVLDQDGKLYGVAIFGGPQFQGALFKLVPSTKKYWTETASYLTGNAGAFPQGLVVDPAVSGTSTFYGVANETNGTSDTSGYGTIFSWTP